MKSKFALVLLAALTVAVFNLVYFFIFENMSATRWICWGTIHVSFALFVAAAHSAKSMEDGLVHAYPKLWTAFCLLETMVTVGVLLSIWNPESWKAPAVILAILCFADLFTYIALTSAEEATEASVKRDSSQKFFIQSCAERLGEARKSQTDLALRKQVEKAYDAIRGAQVSTVPAASEIEADIVALVSKLCSASASGSVAEVSSIATEIVATVRRRDMAIRLSH